MFSSKVFGLVKDVFDPVFVTMCFLCVYTGCWWIVTGGISMRSALLGEGIGVSGENHRHAISYWQTLSHNVVSSIPRLTEIWTLLVMEVDILFFNNRSSYRSRYEMRYLPFHNTWYTRCFSSSSLDKVFSMFLFLCKQKKLLPKTMFSINIMYKIRD